MKYFYVVDLSDFNRNNRLDYTSKYLFASFDEQEARAFLYNIASSLTMNEKAEISRELLLVSWSSDNDDLLIDDINNNLVELDCFDGVDPAWILDCVDLNTRLVDDEHEKAN